MKFITYTIILIVLSLGAYGQNHVPNCSFEQYTSCPTGPSQINYAFGWYSYNTGTPDYFNVCSPGNAGVPTNFRGSEAAADGNAYGGAYVYVNSPALPSEYSAIAITPLQVGSLYEVSMSISLSDVSGIGIDGMGVYFLQNGPSTVSTFTILPVTPQVSYSSYGPITIQNGWQRITAVLYADSAYNRLVIGNFKNNTNILTAPAGGTAQYACYYYDSVVVQFITAISLNFNLTQVCNGAINVPYNVNPTSFLPGNVFTLQLSDITGNFSSAVNIGGVASTTSGVIPGIIPPATIPGNGYRVRIISSNPADTSYASNPFAIGTIPANFMVGSNSPVCANNTINLTSSSTTSNTSYSWSGPGGYSAVVQNPGRSGATTAMSGYYVVTANNYGCTARDSTFVTVNPSPNIGASSNAPICTGNTLTLNATSTATGTSYTWYGPNGFTSNLQNPSIPNVTTAASGIYMVVGSLPPCTDTAYVNVTVGIVPATPIAGSNTPVCSGNAIALTAQSITPGVTYHWTGPGGYSIYQQNPTRPNATIAMSGTYSVMALLGGCPSTAGSINIFVDPSPANVTASNNTPICAGGNINLSSSSSTAGVSYSWAGPGGYNSNLQNPTRTNATTTMSGTYTVTAQLGNCSNNTSTTVTVDPTPATPSAGSNSTVCTGNSINLNALSTTPGVTYHWTGPGGYNSNLQNPTRANATLAMSGNYSVVATSGPCASASASAPVVVNQTPGAPTAANNGPLCAGIALDLFANGQTGATYQWDGPASYSSNMQNPTILNSTTANAGAYTVTQTMNGCTSAATTTNVVINNSVNPALAIFPSPNDTICPGQTVVFVASPNNGGTAPLYQWKKNGNNISGANTVNYSTAAVNSGDFFSCQLTSNAACAFPVQVQSNNILMTVEPPQPCAVSITANPGLVLSPWELVTFTATPVRGGLLPSYQWLRNGQKVIGAISNTWSANNLNSNDTISVILYSTDPCALPNTDTSSYLVVNIKTGISNVNGDNSIILYPNPNNGDFVIKGNAAAKNVAIDVVNMMGQTVYHKDIQTERGIPEHTIHLDVAGGIYLLKLVTDEEVETIKFEVK